jgi:hypothetical protein
MLGILNEGACPASSKRVRLEPMAPTNTPPDAHVAISSGRKWLARVLLALFVLWIVVKVIRVASIGDSYLLSREFDFMNPSGFGIVGFMSLIAYFFVRFW